ncbi:hypothetical protein H9W90_11345 [Polaribacter pectinis]|uniref:STAS/SEC14 domain-containing protein n=1 Tax=Polaribacter pectinis TaxID=2738844 RepID=A0A7G9L839_9FLAO|nr:hypothetical protein [Polaribacter pectinis]QNM84788.1 hypothetical protein H9W90_11345 [Polaribacter pectinis]
MHQLISQNIKNPSDLSCKFFSKEKNTEDNTDVLIVSFSGEYPNGSSGKEHGEFIARKAIEGLMSFEAEAIVLDFRKMKYSYGNTLLKVFQDISQFKDAGNNIDEPEFPIIVVTSEKCVKGILTLLTPTNSEENPNWQFNDIHKAINFATKKGKYWLDY